MRCLVTGATGLLGQAVLREASSRAVEAEGLARSGAHHCVDLTDDQALLGVLDAVRPDVVINAAACVDLARCEENPAQAYAINARAVAMLAEACRVRGSRLIQVSTDHYFSGDGPQSHSEDAAVVLLNEYARTKYAGEAFALTCPGALVLRTNIAGFRGDAARPTFAEWLFEAVQSDDGLNAFTDFFTSTIDTGAFARALFDLLAIGANGILNVASRTVSDKKTFATAVAARLGVNAPNITDASVRSLTPVRAESLGLDVSRAEAALGRPLPGLDDVVEALVEEYRRQS